MESATFSLPHFEQNVGLGLSSEGWPQREQNFALGVRFLLHFTHCLKTSNWCPQNGQNFASEGIDL